jgi:hypothetical protein
MKFLFALALILTFGATAMSKPAPVEPQLVAMSPDDLAIATGAAGATLERDYFRAPESSYAEGRIFPCRLQLRIFDKTRLARSCN